MIVFHLFGPPWGDYRNDIVQKYMRRIGLKATANITCCGPIASLGPFQLRKGQTSSSSTHYRAFACKVSDRTMTELDDQIAQDREELGRRPPGHTGRAETLADLAYFLGDKFEETDDIVDLDEAIALHRQALESWYAQRAIPTVIGHTMTFCVTSAANRARFPIWTKPSHWVELHWTCVRQIIHVESRSGSLHRLALCLSDRYKKLASMEDLEQAIMLGRAALDLHPEGHPDRSDSFHNLAVSLSDRYDKQAAIADFEDAITLGRAALDLRPTGHPDRAYSLHHLALYLGGWYYNQASIPDLEEAIMLGRAALELRPTGHPNRSDSLHNLALYLGDRYNKLASIADLEGAIVLGRAALDLRPTGHPGRSVSLHRVVEVQF